MVSYWVARGTLGILAVVPLPVAFMVARVVIRVLDLFVPRFRRVAYRNLEIAGYGRRPDIVAGVFRNLARMLVVFARFPTIHRRNIGEWIRYEGFEHYQEAKRRGNGVLFATGHLGNWELSALGHALMTEPMTVIVRPLDNPVLGRLVEQRRMLAGNRAVGKKESARALLKALNANQPVGVLVDQNSTVSEGVFVDFFGVPACTNAAFVKLAHHSGAAVIPGFALWSETERRYILRFYPPVKMSGDVIVDTQRLHAVIESIIREYPDQWLWIHRRWKTRPPGEPPMY
jgi:KDO2-lipid IV(A) lauroyltransferase